nr:MFS transporter [Glutamicibacter sp.]
MGILAAGLGLVVLDGTIVGVSLPTIIADIHLDLGDAQWVNSLYAVVLAALLLSAGNLSDRWGRKKLFLAGIVVFMAGSLLAANAAAAGPLISARAIQAVGAAFIMPATLSTVNSMFRGKERAAAFGVWGAVISGAAAIGPLAGGLLTEYASWHWIFLVNLPLGAILLVLSIFFVPETRGRVPGRGVDVDGALLSSLGMGALVFAIIEGPEAGWITPSAELKIGSFIWPADAPVSLVAIALLVSAAALTLFIFWERHRARIGRSALLELRLFEHKTFSWGNLTAASVAIGEFALLFVLPLFLVNALGLSTLQAGFILAAMALGAFVSGAAARHLAALLTPAGTVLLGLGIETAGVLILALLLSAEVSAWAIAATLVFYGLGLGLASAQLTGTVLAEVPVQISGQGSATQSTVRQIGSALGTAISGAVLSAALAVTLPARLDDSSVPAAQASQLAEATRQSAGTTISQLRVQPPAGVDPSSAIDALSAGFADATRWSMLAASVFLLLGAAGAWRLLRAQQTSQRLAARA